MAKKRKTDPILAEIRQFLTRTGMSKSAFGKVALNDTKLFWRLQAGRRMWPETEARIRAAITKYDGRAG